MTFLSRKADYSILILCYLQKNQHGGNARAIAEAYGLSRPFVANILKELCQKGYVASHRGVKGGYAILRPLQNVSIADLLESLNEGFKLTLCSPVAVGQEACALESHCSIKGPLSEIHNRMFQVLSNTTILDLIDKNGVENESRQKPVTIALSMAGHCSSKSEQPNNLLIEQTTTNV
jgi:Rrf2 family transcriptional regulator, cysteine metabolism repressor